MNSISSDRQARRLLVIDDDSTITSLFQIIAEDLSFSFECVNEFDDIRGTLSRYQPNFIFLDLKLGGHDGIEVLHYLSKVACKAKILLISGVDQGTLEAAGEVGKLNNLNIVGVIKKPFELDDIERVLTDETDTSSSFSSAAMRELFGAGEFRLMFQPCMAIKTLGGMGVADLDVSANWIGRSRASILDSQTLMPRLESSGLLSHFNENLLEKSIESLSYCNHHGMELGIVIRLHDTVYQENSFPGHVLALARKWGVRPDFITLGINENPLMEYAGPVMDVLTRLRINGFNVSVRVNSTATSELDKLLHLPINEIRLSANVVKSVTSCVDYEIDVCSFIAQCDKHEIFVRAEGVESERVLQLLYESGCTTGLGPHFAIPMKTRDLERWISRVEFTEELRAV